ncbi:MAG: menaquinone biosynthesis protein [Acidobacteriota bacterium]
MTPTRLGAVSYLNARPLVYGLDRRPDLFSLRFDVPSQCAALLHEGRVDVGLIPAVEYLRGEYRIAPGVAVASDGPVLSVAVYTTVPIERVETLALDMSSRTSVALTRVLCARRWGIAPRLTPADPDLRAMLARADAALLIGDPALYVDPAAHDATKIDLGAEWRALTGLPFVYAMWAGRDGALDPCRTAALVAARDAGVGHLAEIAAEATANRPERRAMAEAYLRDNLRYELGDSELAGLGRFHELVVELGLAPGPRPLRFYHA